MGGQTSVEFLVVLVVALVLLGIATMISGEQAAQLNLMKIKSDARSTVDTLAAAAEDVYSQGIGARKKVFVTFPEGYSPSNSFVTNKTININVLESDVAATVDFDVTGSLPNKEGSYWVWVISEANVVRIGESHLYVSEDSIVVSMNRNETKEENFYVENVGSENINLTITSDWSNDLSFSFVPQVFPLSPYETKTIYLTFSSGSNASGVYSGNLYILGKYDGEEAISLPLYVTVVVGDTKPDLSVTPTSWNVTTYQGSSVNQTFTICTNTVTSVSSISFTPSSGSPGSWVGWTSSLGPLGRDSCTTKTLALSVPAGTVAGTYTGYITVSTPETDDVVVSLEVRVTSTDVTGPIVRDISHTPVPAYTTSSVVIRATADDTTTGNSSIYYCQISLDGGAWNGMEAVDGSYNEPIEDVRYTLGTLSVGEHEARLRCTDAALNIGAEYEYEFHVVKEILFILDGQSPNPSEQEWLNWISSHTSAEGFSWEYDTTSDSNVASGSIDLEDYAVVMMSEYQWGGGMEDELRNYLDDGGVVIMMDSALNQGPRALGYTDQPGTSYSGKYVYVLNTSHYITSGYSYGPKAIYMQDDQIYYLKYDFVLYGGSNILSKYRYYFLYVFDPVLGSAGKFYAWGASAPTKLNSDGNTFTTRLIDNGLLTSSIS